MDHKPAWTLDALNAASPQDFAAALDGVFEHAPWVAERAAAGRPYPTVVALHQALFAAVEAETPERQRAFLAGHPELAGDAARAQRMAAFSAGEQAALGLDRLDDARVQQFAALNQAYRARFGIPFILCVRRHTGASVLAQFTRRLQSPPEAEWQAALQEVFWITRLRLVSLVDGPGRPATGGHLSTHVLDTARGCPAEGVVVELFGLDGDTAAPLARATTDADGRVPTLLPAGPLRIGLFELRFHAGDYFRAAAVRLADPPFLDVIPIRFAVAEPEARYHVPLLVSPWSYSTYRGS